MTMITTKFVTTEEELQQIADLSAANLVTNISAEQKAQEGYVTWPYDLAALRAINAVQPSVIAKDGYLVVGYALVLTKEMAPVYEPLAGALEHFATITYEGRNLLDGGTYFMGQICVHVDYRGQGIVEKLYLFHKAQFAAQYDYLVTEISVNNPRSQKAHEKVGFKTIFRQGYMNDEWNVVLWDWK
jgi:ribosomal protein S18 acetylase RimI-like enzyme